MANKKSISELLQEAKDLREQQKKLNAEMKAKKSAIATEYVDNLPEAEKQKQIAEAEKILNTAKAKAELLKVEFKKAMKQIKNDVAFAKEILDFVNYKTNHSLPKVKNQFIVNENMLTLKREGIQQINVDISKANWQKTLKAELNKQGINGNDRIADNIVYKAKCLIESNSK